MGEWRAAKKELAGKRYMVRLQYSQGFLLVIGHGVLVPTVSGDYGLLTDGNRYSLQMHLLAAAIAVALLARMRVGMTMPAAHAMVILGAKTLHPRPPKTKNKRRAWE